MRRSIAVVLLTLTMLSSATPAWAQDAQDEEAFVVLSGRADVPAGEQVGIWSCFTARQPWTAPSTDRRPPLMHRSPSPAG